MPLPLHIVALVLLAAVLHATWNAVIKAGEDRALTMALVIGTGSVLALPVLPFVQVPAAESWLYLLLSFLLHVGYFFFLLQAYKVGDLSHVYPVARGAAPKTALKLFARMMPTAIVLPNTVTSGWRRNGR